MVPRYFTRVAGPNLHFPALMVSPAAVASYSSSIAAIRVSRIDLVSAKKSSTYEVKRSECPQILWRRQDAASEVATRENTAHDGAKPKPRARMRK